MQKITTKQEALDYFYAEGYAVGAQTQAAYRMDKVVGVEIASWFWVGEQESDDLIEHANVFREQKVLKAAPELLAACEAADQCITDLIELYKRGGSFATLDQAVMSCRDDALRLVNIALKKAGAK